MSTIHLPAGHPAFDLVKLAYPDYSGRKLSVEVSASPFDFTSYWDSGSRDYHVLIRLADMQIMPVPQNGTAYDRQQIGESVIQPGFAVVSRHYRGTSPEWITITIHPDTAGRFALPAPTELTWAERVVLVATRSFKSSYAGVSNYRFHEATRTVGITLEEWNTAKAALISRKLLNAAGAVTVDGKNAAGNTQLYTLKREEAAC